MHHKRDGKFHPFSRFYNGRGGQIRTGDPLHPMQVRYRAALRPAPTTNYNMGANPRQTEVCKLRAFRFSAMSLRAQRGNLVGKANPATGSSLPRRFAPRNDIREQSKDPDANSRHFEWSAQIHHPFHLDLVEASPGVRRNVAPTPKVALSRSTGRLLMLPPPRHQPTSIQAALAKQSTLMQTSCTFVSCRRLNRVWYPPRATSPPLKVTVTPSLITP